MDSIQAVILGIVQGLTEFFPVSSSGHLAMMQAFFGGRESGDLLFEVAVHVATLIAIVFYYRERISELLHGTLRRDPFAIDYVSKLVVATLPAVVVGLTANDLVERQFSNPMFVGFALIATGFIVASTRWTAARATATTPGWGAVVAIGVAQAFAILPGISRSGSTVAMALAFGVAPLIAAEFSFLMGVIAISGAAILMLPELGEVDIQGLEHIAAGGVAALLSGLLAIWLFVRMLDRSLFQYWAAYCWVAGAAFLTWSAAQ